MQTETVKKPCPECGSKDNLVEWTAPDGNRVEQCKNPSCGRHQTTRVGLVPREIQDNTGMTVELRGDYKEYRGIYQCVCEKYDVQVADLFGKETIIYNHHNLDGTVDQKYRIVEDKKFGWGKPKSNNTNLFGLSACKDYNAPIIITEGNEDAMSWAMAGLQGCSLLSASTVLNDTDILELQKYPFIVLNTDSDSAGEIAGQKVKSLLQGTKVLKQVDLSPYKDANEALLEAGADFLTEKYKAAKEIVPEGLKFGSQLDFEDLKAPLPDPVKSGIQGLDELLNGGFRSGWLIELTAGSGLGKSSILRHIGNRLKDSNKKGLVLFIEESEKIAPLSYLNLNTPVGDIITNPSKINQTEWDNAVESRLNTDDLIFCDKNWERSVDNLINTCAWAINVKKVDYIILDHITAVISSNSKTNTVAAIDELMERLYNLVVDTQAFIIAAVHLSKPQQPPYWDEGRKPSMYDLKGSGALAQKPDVIIGLSRNQKSVGGARDLVTVEVLKNRWFGKLGECAIMSYLNTGKFEEDE